jgi:hypothetical protein
MERTGCAGEYGQSGRGHVVELCLEEVVVRPIDDCEASEVRRNPLHKGQSGEIGTAATTCGRELFMPFGTGRLGWES